MAEEKTMSQATHRLTDQITEQMTEQAGGQTAEQTTDPAGGRTAEQMVDQAAAQIAAPADSETEVECPHCARHKKRTPEEQKVLTTRLKKIEGQIRGIEKMVETDAYCPDILIQVSAATSALNSFNKVLLQCHIRSCVAEDIRSGKDEAIDELCQVLQKLMK